MKNQFKHSFPKKHLGQNFLINQHIKDRIISACNINQNDVILEIGPGKGALTFDIVNIAKEIIAIEKDKNLADELKNHFIQENCTIIEGDFIKYSLQLLPKGLKVIGNLPYNMATPIITKIIKHPQIFHCLYITVQLEHGLKMIAKPNTKNYGSLSCFVQYYCDVKKLFNIKNTCFYPAPKVQSCFLSLLINKQPKTPTANENLLFTITNLAFQQRRKTILNSLSSLAGKPVMEEILKGLKIKSSLRAENLTIRDYVQISDQLNILNNKKGRVLKKSS